MKRRTKILIAVPMVVLGLQAISTASVIMIERMQHARNSAVADRLRRSSLVNQNNSLVVYFSRSGNTELMALEIARVKQASVVRLDDENYQIGLRGWVNAMRDARGHEAAITPAKVDLSGFETIYLGAPIWLYSPAPPVWQFVRNNDLSGKRVILFNSLNSKFEQRYIDAFAALVRERGGTFAKHIYIVRGRMTRQLDVDEFRRVAREKAKGV